MQFDIDEIENLVYCVLADVGLIERICNNFDIFKVAINRDNENDGNYVIMVNNMANRLIAPDTNPDDFRNARNRASGIIKGVLKSDFVTILIYQDSYEVSIYGIPKDAIDVPEAV